jgi:hypothetical protein
MNGTTTNKSTINLITGTLAFMALVAVVTICICACYGIKIPPELNTLAGGLVGSLGAMLVKTAPTETTKAVLPNGTAPTAVQVVNKPADPVPTTTEIKA